MYGGRLNTTHAVGAFRKGTDRIDENESLTTETPTDICFSGFSLLDVSYSRRSRFTGNVKPQIGAKKRSGSPAPSGLSTVTT